MRLFILIVLTLSLTACSIEKMAEKMLPDDIELQSQDVVTAVFEQDMDFFLPLKGEEVDLESFNKNVEAMFGQKSKGDIISRHIVSANVSSNISTEKGKTKDINIGHEVKTSEGFTLISTRFYQGSEDTKCCTLSM